MCLQVPLFPYELGTTAEGIDIAGGDIKKALRGCNDCATECDNEPGCVGFSKSNTADVCYLKEVSVLGFPESVNGFTFYQKPGVVSSDATVELYFPDASLSRRRALLQESGDVNSTVAEAVSAGLQVYFGNGTYPRINSATELAEGGVEIVTTVSAVGPKNESFAASLERLWEAPGDVILDALTGLQEYSSVVASLETAAAKVVETSDAEVQQALQSAGSYDVWTPGVPVPDDADDDSGAVQANGGSDDDEDVVVVVVAVLAAVLAVIVVVVVVVVKCCKEKGDSQTKAAEEFSNMEQEDVPA